MIKANYNNNNYKNKINNKKLKYKILIKKTIIQIKMFNNNK